MPTHALPKEIMDRCINHCREAMGPLGYFEKKVAEAAANFVFNEFMSTRETYRLGIKELESEILAQKESIRELNLRLGETKEWINSHL